MGGAYVARYRLAGAMGHGGEWFAGVLPAPRGFLFLGEEIKWEKLEGDRARIFWYTGRARDCGPEEQENRRSLTRTPLLRTIVASQKNDRNGSHWLETPAEKVEVQFIQRRWM